MNALSYEYQKVRRLFGRNPKFGDTGLTAFSIGEEDEDDECHSQWIEKEQSTINLDCINRFAEHEANTEKFIQTNAGVLHVDGAWPKDIKTSEFVDRQRYLRRITNEAGYQQAVMQLIKNSESALQQNNTIDLFEDYFETEEEPVEYSSEPPSCRTLAVFRDPNEIKRSATHISWHPDLATKMAISYSILQFQQMPEKMPIDSYIWDVNSPNGPDAELHPQSPLTCCVYNPRSPDHIVGGCYNGMIAFWDIRKGKEPEKSSILEHSHHDPCYDVYWIQSRNGSECCSVSTDGRLLWWDTRNLSKGPTDEMLLEQGDTTYGGTSLEYRSDAGATKYLVGTEQGQVVLVDRKASKDKGSQKSIKAVFGEKNGRHHGPVYSIQRNPTNQKYFLTVGDWTTKIWTEDLKAPLLTTKYSISYLTAASWSPTRPGVFFTTKQDGTLDVWDFFYKQNDPVFTTKVGDYGLTSMAVQNYGKLVAVGSEDGTTSVLELSSALCNIQPDEKNSIAAMFEREHKREKNLETRLVQRKRDQKERERQAAEDSQVFDPAADWDQKTQEAIQKAEEAFYAAMKKAEEEEAGAEAASAEGAPPG